MSVVYLGLQESLKRHVALKVLRLGGGASDTIADRFIHEAETIARLDHPNIVGIHDVGRAEDGSPYYAMPFLDHGDLRSVQYEGDDERLIGLLDALCRGLSYAHSHGVIHRDIKPENVLFDKFGTPQIADFGIALTEGNRRWTKEGEVIGSVCYMSPEQCQGRPVDARSDLYSLGVIAWELLAGEPPFDAEDDMGVMLAQVSERLPKLPWELRHWLPLLHRALAKKPEQRYQAIEDFRQDLIRIPRTVPGRWLRRLRVSVVDWFSRWRRRLIMMLFVLTLMVALAAAGYFWRQSRLPDEQPAPSTPPAEANTEVESPPVASDPPTTAPEPEVADPVEEPEPGAPELAISAEQALQKVEEALALIEQDRLTRPEEDNAADRLVSVLEVYPDHPQALDAVAGLSTRYRQLVLDAVQEADYPRAAEYTASLADVWQRAGLPLERFPLVVSAVMDSVESAVELETRRLDAISAEEALGVALALDPNSDRRQAVSEHIGSIPGPGELIEDSQGADTIFVPRRLQRPDESLHRAKEGFALMPREVTKAEYEQFVEQRGWPDSSCRRGDAPAQIRSRSWREPGFEQEADHPVVCIRWLDAVAYAEWLSARSGHLYRLPTSAEWYHAAWIGHDALLACETGNVGGQEAAAFLESPLNCDDGQLFSVATRQFQPNRLGLFDLRGNVREWAEDCAAAGSGFDEFLDRLNLKEADPCDRRAVRGTGWLDGRGASMLGLRTFEDADDARPYIGFRLLRDLVAERERERQRE